MNSRSYIMLVSETEYLSKEPDSLACISHLHLKSYPHIFPSMPRTSSVHKLHGHEPVKNIYTVNRKHCQYRKVIFWRRKNETRIPTQSDSRACTLNLFTISPLPSASPCDTPWYLPILKKNVSKEKKFYLTIHNPIRL